jgi:outer membrane protein TolC
LALTVTEAVLTALEHNVVFQLERLRPEIGRAAEQVERAAFDPSVSVTASYGEVTGLDESDGFEAEGELGNTFPTGTAAAVRAGYQDVTENHATTRATAWELEVTQALLRGRRPAANLARLHQARLDTQMSEYELRAVAEALVAAVETAYWSCVLAQEKIDIYERSLVVAEQQIGEVRERVAIGQVAEIELAAAEAEVAEKREELLAARGELARRLLGFRRLLAPATAPSGWWTRRLGFADRPTPPDGELGDVETHVQLGLRNRADLAQARLLRERGELDVVRTRDGVLPQLDLFARLGGTHYAEAFAAPAGEDDNAELTVGVTLALPLLLREERARHRIAQLDHRQQQLALANQEQLLQLDVRSAHVNVQVAREQIVATGATRKLRQDALTAEQEKFRVGTSTTLQVAQAWRDLLASQISEVEAMVNCHKALITLSRLDGTLLDRRGIDAPGRRAGWR